LRSHDRASVDILFLITARGGSKGIPNKNLREIGGISLVGYRAISAQKCRHCTRLVLSSDSEKIQADARSYGVEVPFTRPAELATDQALSWEVIDHTMQWIETEEGGTYDAIMLLEPSSPFTRPSDYDRAVEMMVSTDAQAVVAMKETEVKSVYIAPLGPKGELTHYIDGMAERARGRRQDGETEFTAAGGLYLFRWEYFRKHKDIYHDRLATFGLQIEQPYCLEIDQPIDLAYAEFLIERGFVDQKIWKS